MLGYGPQPSFSARPSRRPSATGVGPAPRLRGGAGSWCPEAPGGALRAQAPGSPPAHAGRGPLHSWLRRVPDTDGGRAGRDLAGSLDAPRLLSALLAARGHRTHGHGRPDLQTGAPRVFKHKTCAHLQLSPGSIPQRLRALGVVQVQSLQRGAWVATRAPACGAGRAGFKLILWRLAEDRLRRARSPSRGLPAGEGGRREERTPGTDSC